MNAPADISSFFLVWGLSPGSNEVGPVIWSKWVPEALEDGSLKCKPQPEVVGKGLQHIQAALDRYKQGVSGRKLVVELP